MELRNDTGVSFVDISSEECREYFFPYGGSFTIDRPLYLGIRPSGNHLVLDEDGYSYHINLQTGVVIKWLAKDGEPHFVN